MEKQKVYEVECHRTNISPKQFWSYCCRQFKKKTGMEFSWIDDFNAWANPYMPCNDKWKHEDWDEPQLEICKIMSMDFHMYLEGSYNFIMEWFDGIGYMYAVEYEK